MYNQHTHKKKCDNYFHISTFQVTSNNIRNYFHKNVLKLLLRESFPTKYQMQLKVSSENI